MTRPIRDLFDVRRIAEIVSRFDVVAIQEVRQPDGPADPLMLPAQLGHDHDGRHARQGGEQRAHGASPSTSAGRDQWARGRARRRHRDRDERDRQRARPAVRAHAVRGQLRRRPDTAHARDLHVLYGDETARAAELREIAAWLPCWARRSATGTRTWSLGDLNIDRRGDLVAEAFTSPGDRAGAAAQRGGRGRSSSIRGEKFYDQIARLSTSAARCSRSRPRPQKLRLRPASARPSKTTPSWKVSDHYPLWVEFSVR